MNQGWAEMDGNDGHHWPAQPPVIPPSFYATPTDPLVSPDYEGWWQRSLALAKKVWKPALILHAILMLPTLALTVPANARFNRENQALQSAMLDDTIGSAPLGGYVRAAALLMAALLVSSLVSVIATAIAVRLVVLAATGQPVSLKVAAGAGLRRAHAVIGWGFLGGLLAAASILMCFLPIIYVSAVLMVLTVVVTVERGSGIGRCFKIFHADLGTSVARVATVFAITTVSAMVLGVIGVAFEFSVGGTVGTVISGVFDGIYYLLAGMAVPPLLVTTYADMRSRREPFSTAYLAPQAINPTA